MTTREELVEHLWQTVINPVRDPVALERIVEHCRRVPDGSFAAVGPAIERALAAGVSPQDLCLINQLTAYEAVFGTLYALGDPGVDDGDLLGLYELMSGAPSADFGPPVPAGS